jgi:beta-fructofuranosidase
MLQLWSNSRCAMPCCAVLCRYEYGRFDLDNAIGPFRLDLGDVLYAPNVMRDDHGRVVMWGWLQEKRTVGLCYCYLQCCCSCVCLIVVLFGHVCCVRQT